MIPDGPYAQFIRDLLRSRPARIVSILALTATAAEFIGPVLAAGLAAPLLRLAMNQALAPLAGAIEAGILASAVWWAFEA